MARYNPDKMAEEIAQKVLDEYVYEGKTLREWVRLIKALDAGEQVSPLRSAPVEMTTRLLTLEEALSVKGCGWEEIWFDADEEEGTAEYKECFECVFIGGYGADRDGAVIEIDPEKYNKAHHHRLWLGEEKPTDAQREAEPWEETSSDPLTRATFPSQGKALDAAYPADLMEHRHSGLLEED